jgi:hypothetical protein
LRPRVADREDEPMRSRAVTVTPARGARLRFERLATG